MLTLTACGSSSGPSWQSVGGNGFRFDAPAAWAVSQRASEIAASHGRVELVQVVTYRLQRAYRATLFAAAARELDRRVAQLAHLQHGRVASRSTVVVDGMNARSYGLSYGALVEEITFLLDDRREYELLCRRMASTPDTICRRFRESFRLG